MRGPDALRLALRRASEVSPLAPAAGSVLRLSSREARFESGMGPLVSALTQLCFGGRFSEYASRMHVRVVSGGWPAVGLSSAEEVRVLLSAHLLAGQHGGPVRVTDLEGVRGPLEAVGVRAQAEQLTRWLELDLDGGHELPAGVVVARLADALGVPLSAFQVTTSSPRGELEGRYRARALLDRYVPVGELRGLLDPALGRAGLGSLAAGSLELFPGAVNTRLPFGWGGCTILELDEAGRELVRERLSPGGAMGDLAQRPGVPFPCSSEQAEAPCPTPAVPEVTLVAPRPRERVAARRLRIRSLDRGPSEAVSALVACGCGPGGSEEAARVLALDLRRRFETLEEAESELERVAPAMGAGSRAGSRGRFAAKARRALHRWWSCSDWDGGGLATAPIPLWQAQWALTRAQFTSEPSRALRIALYGLGWLAGHDGGVEGPEIAWTLWEAASGGRRDYASLRGELEMFEITRSELTPAAALMLEVREGTSVTPYSRRWWLSESVPRPNGGEDPVAMRTVDPFGDPWGTVCALVAARPDVSGAELGSLLSALGVRQVEVARRGGRSQATVSRALRQASALPCWLLEAMNIHQGQESTPSSPVDVFEGLGVVEASGRENGRASRVGDEGSPSIFPAKCVPEGLVEPGVGRARGESSRSWPSRLAEDSGVCARVRVRGLVGARTCARGGDPSRRGVWTSGVDPPSRACPRASDGRPSLTDRQSLISTVEVFAECDFSDFRHFLVGVVSVIPPTLVQYRRDVDGGRPDRNAVRSPNPGCGACPLPRGPSNSLALSR